MRVSRWLDNLKLDYWTQPIIYQKKRELALYNWHKLWALPIVNIGVAVAAVSSLLCAEGQRKRGPKEPIARNTHIFAT